MQVKFIQMKTSQSGYNGVFKWQAAGMCDIIQTAKNTFIMVDGGHPEDGPRIVELLKKLSGEEKPRIPLWLLTHPHGDHYLALQAIANDPALRSQLEIGQFAYRVPEIKSEPGAGTPLEEELRVEIRDVEDIIAKLGVSVLTPASDMWLDIDGVGLRFFSTAADVKSTPFVNDLSLVFQVIGPHRTVMVTGDVHERGATPIAFRYWDELKSDICQLGHHGLDGGSVAFYQKVNAKTVLIPISESGYRYIHDLGAGYVPPLYAERLAERAIKAYEGDAVLYI